MYDFPTHLYQLTGVGLLELCLNQWFYPGPEVLDHASGTINVLRIFDSLSESNSSEPELETGNGQCILAPWLSMTHVHVESCSGSFGVFRTGGVVATILLLGLVMKILSDKFCPGSFLCLKCSKLPDKTAWNEIYPR